MKIVLQLLFALVAIALVGVIIARLSVNGWSSLLWLVMMVAISVIRMPYASQIKANLITDRWSVSSERVLLVLVSIGGTFLPLIHLTTGVLSFADYQLPTWAVVVAAILMIPGCWLFWRSHADLGRNWSVTTELREGQELITSGVYTRVRHPMYTSIWLLFLLLPFFVQNWIAGLAGPIAFAILYFIRVPNEEAMMRKQFGQAYDDYCRRTGRLLPKRSVGSQ